MPPGGIGRDTAENSGDQIDAGKALRSQKYLSYFVTAHCTDALHHRMPKPRELVASSLCRRYSSVENGSLDISRLLFCKWQATRSRGRGSKEI